MKIEKLALENFRRFVELDIAFDPSLTVIVGINGAGKTSILDGIALLIGRLLTRLPQVSGVALSPKDLHINNGTSLAPGVRCYLQADMGTKQSPAPLAWSTSRLRDKSLKTAKIVRATLREETNVGVNSIDKFADRLIDAENESQPYHMPVVAYYGTQRATVSAPLKRRNFATSFARFGSLTGALNPAANFKQVFEWIHAKENDEAREQKKRKSFDYQDLELQTVRTAIESFFPHFKNPRTETNPLRFVVDTEYSGVAVTCDLSQLSDGYRTTLALVADLACRMARANPASHTTPNPLETDAVVLIDEIELHLHPGWQQTILADLRRVFPCTQFIVTTHSPQVLTTVEPECIRIIDWDGAEQNRKPILEIPTFSIGAESQYVLETLLGVPRRPAGIPIARQLEEYLTLVNNNQWDSPRAVELRTTLDTWSRERRYRACTDQSRYRHSRSRLETGCTETMKAVKKSVLGPALMASYVATHPGARKASIEKMTAVLDALIQEGAANPAATLAEQFLDPQQPQWTAFPTCTRWVLGEQADPYLATNNFAG